jgi:hypothetical protein
MDAAIRPPRDSPSPVPVMEERLDLRNANAVKNVINIRLIYVQAKPF